MATNPSGCWKSSSAATTPVIAIGTTIRHSASMLKLCNWIIRKVIISSSISGTTAMTEAWDFALSSTVPPTSIR